MSRQFPLTGRKLVMTAVAGLLAFLIFGGLTSFILDPPKIIIAHILFEIAGIVLGCIIFFIAWYGTGISHIRIAVGSLAIISSVILDLVHLLAFPGTLHGVAGETTHIWMASWLFSRIIWSFGLLYAVTLPDRACNGSCGKALLYGTLIAVAGLVADIVIAPNFWPYLYSIDRYDHPLVVFGPWVAFAANLAAFVILCRRPLDHVGSLPQFAVLFGALADLCFAVAGHTPASFNIAAHLFKTLGSLFILRALYIAVIRQPYAEAMSLKEEMEKLADKNARLYQESEQQRNQFEDTLAKIGMIISSQLNLEETLDAIADTVADMMRARQSVIALFTEDRTALRVVANYGMNTPPDTIPLESSLAGQACITRSALVADDLLLRPELFRPQLVFTNIRSIVTAPLVNDKEIIGVIEAYSSEKSAFTPRDALLLQALGYHAGAAVAGATLHEQLKTRLDEEKFLYQISQVSAATIDTDTILEQCLASVAQALGADFALAFLTVDRPGGALAYKAAVGLSFRPADLDLDAFPDLATLVRAHIPAVLPTGQCPPLTGLCGDGAAGPVMVMPLAVNSRLLGLIFLGWRRFVDPEGLRRTSFAALMATQIALGLEKAGLYNQVKAMALSDGLTGLANRRNFDMFLDTELRRASTLKRPLSLAMLDLDKFKVYNDTYGHPTGDKLLAQLGEILRQTTRTIDFPARYGGEEFAVILPECGAAEAAALGEKVRAVVEAGAFPDNAGTFTAHITASLGIATYDPSLGVPAPDAARFIAVADSALYQAKQAGRNRVVSAPVIG